MSFITAVIMNFFCLGTSNEGEAHTANATGHGYFSDVEDEQDEASDEEYVPREALRREIRVGPEYQADVPSVAEAGMGPTENGTNECAVKHENDADDDLLLWKPGYANEDQGTHIFICALLLLSVLIRTNITENRPA